GRELRDSTAAEWLTVAGGSTAAAWIGKLAPYVLYDLALMLVLVGGFVAWFHIPVLGNLGFLALGAVAFSLASKSISVLLTVWLANLRKALGVGSLFFGTAVAFSGVTFPRIAMSTFAQLWSGVVPLTRFMLLFRASVFYAFFYPTPYLKQILRDLPIVVVDRDHTALRRQLTRWLDASE